MYDRLHSHLQIKLQHLQEINNQADKLTRAPIKESMAFNRAQRLLVSIKDTEKRADDALSQQNVLIHVSTRCKDETTTLDRDLTELQLTKAKLDEELREQSKIARALTRDISNEEASLKKVLENVERGGLYQQVASNDFAKMNEFRSYQVAKQQKRAKHRQKILSKVIC